MQWVLSSQVCYVSVLSGLPLFNSSFFFQIPHFGIFPKFTFMRLQNCNLCPLMIGSINIQCNIAMKQTVWMPAWSQINWSDYLCYLEPEKITVQTVLRYTLYSFLTESSLTEWPGIWYLPYQFCKMCCQTHWSSSAGFHKTLSIFNKVSTGEWPNLQLFVTGCMKHYKFFITHLCYILVMN